jgi:hypothetical protein
MFIGFARVIKYMIHSGSAPNHSNHILAGLSKAPLHFIQTHARLRHTPDGIRVIVVAGTHACKLHHRAGYEHLVDRYTKFSIGAH